MKNNLKIIADYIRKFQLNSIFVRNLILVTLAMLLPIASISCIFYFNTQTAVNKEISTITQGNATTIKSISDTIFRTTELLAIQTTLNQDVQNLCLNVSGSNYGISNTYQRVRSYISSHTNTHPYINSIYVYSERLKIVIDNQEILPLADFEDSGWLDYYANGDPKKTMFVPRKKYDTYPSFISVIRNIYIEDIGKIGCVVINIDTEHLNSLIGDVKEAIFNNTVILDKNNCILLCQNTESIGNQLSSYLEIKNPEKLFGNSFGNIRIKNQSYVYAICNSDRYDLTYMQLIPKIHFNNIVKQPFSLLLLTFSILIFAGVIISVLISVKIYAPIRNVMDILLPSQSLEQDKKNKRDEFAYITDAIKKNMDKTEALTEELNYRMLLLKEAQAYALQAQINPHFLNNTLEAINWTAISNLGEENKISQMIKHLSALFDISLVNDHYLIPIEEELQHTDIYIKIIRLNYGSELKFTLDFDPEIIHSNIIKLSLQPILENAVVHGISPKGGKGEIIIRGILHEGGILVTVSDNGVGMSEETLYKLQKELKSNSLQGTHIGIKNVNQRIKLIFGEEYGISVISKKGKGTDVSLFIPKTEL